MTTTEHLTQQIISQSNIVLQEPTKTTSCSMCFESQLFFTSLPRVDLQCFTSSLSTCQYTFCCLHLSVFFSWLSVLLFFYPTCPPLLDSQFNNMFSLNLFHITKATFPVFPLLSTLSLHPSILLILSSRVQSDVICQSAGMQHLHAFT